MVDSSIVGCRCACAVEDPYGADDNDDSSEGCCTPQLFTSILLGILACVLMTGGVFLAFHRWDPLWLIVSGVGVILILIGSILHCCTHGVEKSGGRRQLSGGKGCCGRPAPDHVHGHLVANNGSLTEQLLPLSNARSVSQLSLNMLPGYFPPVVTTYGIEQHSAVVQNINRIIQQQQQTVPATHGTAPSVSAGKSFILLSLPGETNPTNIQNLVATMYQMEDGTTTEVPVGDSPASVPSTPAPPPTPTFKSVEVQTCNIWPIALPNPVANSEASTSTTNSIPTGQSESSMNNGSNEQQGPSTSIALDTTQTQRSDIRVPGDTANLMTLGSVAICDNPRQSSDACADANIPSHVLVDVSEIAVTSVLEPPLNSILDRPAPLPEVVLDIPDVLESSSGVSATSSSVSATSAAVSSTSPGVPVVPSGVPAAFSSASAASSAVTATASGVSATSSSMPAASSGVSAPSSSEPAATSSSVSATSSAVSANAPGVCASYPVASSDVLVDILERPNLQTEEVTYDVLPARVLRVNSDQIATVQFEPAAGPSSQSEDWNSNLSVQDLELDDVDSVGRSSPPPSYDDVATSAVAAFGLAYGTL